MEKRYYRVHPGQRPVESLLDESTWQSRAWVGEYERRCADCHGTGEADDGMRCDVCHGRGRVEDVRRGVSCMTSIEELRDYMVERHANLDGDVIVELEGDVSDDEDHEAEAGAVLILPRKIVSVRPVPAEWSEK